MTPRNLKELEPRIHQCTDDLLDAMGQHGSGDFHDLLACPLPVWVIGQLLGVTGSLDRFKDLSDALMHEGMNNTDPKKFLAVLAELDEYWADQLAGRRKVLSAMDPDEIGPHLLGEELPDDMISRLLVFRADDGRLLTEFEISNTLMNLLLAGNETTTSLLTNLVWRLLEDRSRWEALLEDRSLLPGAIEESLRYDAPTLGMFRTSTTDTTLDGTPIPAMSKIQANYAAANHDPEIFDHPDEFRIDRPRSESLRHLAFGRGTHACPGASLSRIETMIAMEKLLDRFPDLRLDGPSERITPFNFWGRRILPVAW